MRRRQFVGAALAIGMGASPGCIGFEAASETTTREFDVEEGETVTVAGGDADVAVHSAGDADRVTATLTKHDEVGNEDALSKIRLQADRSGETLTLTVVDDTGDGAVQATHADLELAVPASTRVSSAESEDGDVDVDGVRGDLTVEVEDGDVNVGDVTGAVSITAADGDVTATGTDGDVTVHAEDGDVEIRGTSGFVTAQAEDGDVRIRDAGGIDGVRTEDGDLDVDIAAVRSDVDVVADDGDITGRVSTSLDAHVTVATDDGDVDVDGLGTDGDGTTGDEWADATFGEGTHELGIRTEDGDVTLSSLE